MVDPQLTTVTRSQGNNQALKDGTVTPVGYSFRFEEVPVLISAFRRMVRELAYDVCEMALTTYLCAREHGVRFTALPIFLARGFHHGAIRFHTGSDIRTPKDLEGRRVGVSRGYTVTTGVWARGILASEYGVDLDTITWVLSGDEHVSSYEPPANVVPADRERDLAAMLLAGEIDALIGPDVDHPDVKSLIPDADEAAYEALAARRLYPINHLVVVRDDLLASHPAVAVAVFDAFAEAKRRYVDRIRADRIEAPTATDRRYRRVLEVTGSDPLPYGVEPNRPMLEELIGHARRQGILTRRVAPEEIFAEATSDRSA